MMDGDIEKTLEFDKIKGIIAGYCASGLGKSLAEKLKPLTDAAQIQRMLNICSEAKGIRAAGGGFPLGGLRDIRRLMKKAEVSGAILEPEELLDITSTVQVARHLKEFAEESAEQYHINVLPTLVINDEVVLVNAIWCCRARGTGFFPPRGSA